MDLEKENIRLQEANLNLMRENDYLRILLDRFIPIPTNRIIEGLENRYNNINERLKRIENMEDKR